MKHITRHTSRIARHLALVLTFALVVTSFTACSPSSLVKNADRIASVLLQARPVFQSLIDGGVIPTSNGAQIIARLAQGASDAKLLADAFRNGQTQDAVDTTARVINVLETLISQDAQLIKNQAQRTTVLAILAAADIALHVIADNLLKTAQDNSRLFSMMTAWAPQKTKASVEVIRRYAAKPKLRCRNSITGRFEKMSVCKAHPDITTVERVK